MGYVKYTHLTRRVRARCTYPSHELHGIVPLDITRHPYAYTKLENRSTRWISYSRMDAFYTNGFRMGCSPVNISYSLFLPVVLVHIRHSRRYVQSNVSTLWGYSLCFLGVFFSVEKMGGYCLHTIKFQGHL